MKSKKFILRETLFLTVGQAVCVVAIIGLYALLGALDRTVILGCGIGAVLGIGNFFFMAVSADNAADKAVEQDVKAGKAIVRGSFITRMVVMLVVLIAFAKSGLANPLAMVIPVFLVRPILSLAEFFRKSGDLPS